MTRPEKWNWLHRDAEGNALLDSPNCPDCLRRSVEQYRCTGCGDRFSVPGVFKWSWQGKSHYFDADDEEEWGRVVLEHWHRHGGKSMVVPAG